MVKGAGRSRGGSGAAPDEIFWALQRYAGGSPGAPHQQVAVMTVLSHFFQTCDIFERPDPEATPA